MASTGNLNPSLYFICHSTAKLNVINSEVNTIG